MEEEDKELQDADVDAEGEGDNSEESLEEKIPYFNTAETSM